MNSNDDSGRMNNNNIPDSAHLDDYLGEPYPYVYHEVEEEEEEEVENQEGKESVFFGYELLTLNVLFSEKSSSSSSPSPPPSWINRFSKSRFQTGSSDSWFLDIAFRRRKSRRRLSLFLRDFQDSLFPFPTSTSLFSTYFNRFHFTEFYLDNVFRDTKVPLISELFRSSPSNLRILSLKSNSLDRLPPEIGRLRKLSSLYLTNNRLENFRIPNSLTFCRKLKELYLDFNLLDALPGFLLAMPSLKTVHRHGNHNYFKATFMWYHTDVHDRILEDRKGYRKESQESSQQELPKGPETLQVLSAKRVISARIEYFRCLEIPESIKDFITGLYDLYDVCDHCQSALSKTSSGGYRVYTFKNPYLGNTCVPFLHWACSWDCAKAIEIPARVEQQTAAQEQDRKYENYIRKAEAEATSPPVIYNTTTSCILL